MNEIQKDALRLDNIDESSESNQRFWTCPCCNCTQFKLIWQNSFFQTPTLASEFMHGSRKFIEKIIQCIECKFAFIDTPIPGDGFYTTVNSEEYSSLAPARLKYFTNIKSDLLRRNIILDSKSSILDMGAGQGDWLALWPEVPSRCATEIQPSYIKKMQSNGIKVIQNLDETKILYEMITAFDYLEHVLDPSELIKCLASKISPSGALVIGVPNMGNWLARFFGTRYYLYCPMHYSYFTHTSLLKILSPHFRSVEIFPSPPMFATINAATKWIAPKLSHQSLNNIWLPIGYSASLIAIAKNPI